MLMVITATGVLSVTGAITIGMLMTADTRGGESLVHQTSIARLSAQFRGDVHATTEASIKEFNGAEQRQLILQQIDGSKITYQASDGMIDRQVDGIDDGDETQNERYRLPVGQSHFEFLEGDRIVRLVHEAPRQPMSEVAAGDLPASSTDRVTIEAAMTWDSRHADFIQRNVDTEE
jgi:hypothetical protein